MKQWIRTTLLATTLIKQLTPLLATTFINNWLSNHCFWWHFLVPALALSHLFPLNRNTVEIKELKAVLPLPLSSRTSIYIVPFCYIHVHFDIRPIFYETHFPQLQWLSFFLWNYLFCHFRIRDLTQSFLKGIRYHFIFSCEQLNWHFESWFL